MSSIKELVQVYYVPKSTRVFTSDKGENSIAMVKLSDVERLYSAFKFKLDELKKPKFTLPWKK